MSLAEGAGVWESKSAARPYWKWQDFASEN